MSDKPTNRLIDDSDPEVETPPIAPSIAGSLPPSPTRRPRQLPNWEKGGVYPGRRKVTAYIDEQLFRRLKGISALHSKPMVEIMEEALHAFAASYAARAKFQG
jgi:hypothetical protein